MRKGEIMGKVFGIALLCLVVAASTVGCGPAASTQRPVHQGSEGLIEKLTLDELTAKADSLLLGKVTDIASYRDGEASISTLVTLSVEQTIKGPTQQEVAIRILGGELNGQTLWVEDAPSFESGERVVVFLEESEGILSVVGGSQGKFSIDENNMVSGNLSLTEFVRQIRDILAKQ